jgi:hypothetical protein
MWGCGIAYALGIKQQVMKCLYLWHLQNTTFQAHSVLDPNSPKVPAPCTARWPRADSPEVQSSAKGLVTLINELEDLGFRDKTILTVLTWLADIWSLCGWTINDQPQAKEHRRYGRSDHARRAFPYWPSRWMSYCTISTHSSVTGHKALRREEFIGLSQVTLATEEMDRNFRRLRHCHHCWLSSSWELGWRDARCVTAHPGHRRDPHLFVAVTGHKGRRVGRNSTVLLRRQCCH